MKKYIIGLLVLFCVMLTGCGRGMFSEPEKKVLTLAVFKSESQLQGSELVRWMNRYNAEQTDVQIEVVNYLEGYQDLEEALNQIKIEINAGKGPDMIDFGTLYSPIDASCGMLEDLNTWIQKDSSFQEQEYYSNILEAFEVGESLYVMIPSYRINSFTTVNGQLAGLERMDIHQLAEAYQALGEEKLLFPGETKKAVFGMICYGSLENYIDWDEGICHFDSAGFKEILEFANCFPLYLNLSEEYSTKQIFMEGKALLYPVTLDSVYGIAGIRQLYGETPTYIGYPFDSGCGTMAAINDIAIGISSTSNHREEAWTFLKSLLQKEFQDNIEDGFPLRASALEQKLRDAENPMYDAEGKKTVQYRLYFEGEEPVEVSDISPGDAETLKALIRKIEHNNSVDSDLYNILLEEVDFLFYENRDVEEVAAVIQSRASIYISEKK